MAREEGVIRFEEVSFEYGHLKPILEEVDFIVRRGAKITLTANKPYYIEALVKEGGGGDNLHHFAGVGCEQHDHHHAARDARRGARLDRRSADLVVAEPVENCGKPVHAFFQKRLYGLRRHVAAGEAGASGRNDHVDIRVGDPRPDLRADLLGGQQQFINTDASVITGVSAFIATDFMPMLSVETTTMHAQLTHKSLRNDTDPPMVAPKIPRYAGLHAEAAPRWAALVDKGRAGEE